jgi:hypothetical protein
MPAQLACPKYIIIIIYLFHTYSQSNDYYYILIPKAMPAQYYCAYLYT